MLDILSLLIELQPPPNNIIFPFYHIVSPINPPHIASIYKPKKPEEFRQDLDKLLEYFQPISLEEVFHYQQTGTQPEKPSFHLTIDDGLKESYTVIAPILKEKNIPATFFINPKFIGNQFLMYRYQQSVILETMKKKNLDNVAGFYPDEILKFTQKETRELDRIAESIGAHFNTYLRDYHPYMTWKQLQVLETDGFTIGGHSNNHPNYKEISLEEQLEETKGSIESIQEHLNPKIRTFAFPFSDDGVSKTFFDWIKSSLDMCFTTAGIKTDIYPWVHNRFSMEAGRAPLENNYLKWSVKNTIGFKYQNTHPDFEFRPER